MRPAPQRSVLRTLRLRPLPAALAATCAVATFAALPASSLAAASPLASADVAHPTARITGAPVATTTLPSRSATAARAGTDGTWLVGVTGDRARAARLVRGAGGTFDATLGVASVPKAKAGELARSLGSSVAWAGPDVVATRLSSFDEPGNVQSPWARSVANAPSLMPLAGTLATIGIVDDAVDSSVAELQSVDVINDVGAIEPHGTMVASTAAAPFDGAGVVGVAPGAQVLSWGTTLSCGDVSNGIVNLVKRGAKVINLSLGFNQNCFALWQATSYAYAHGVPMVVASGNDGDRGNPPSYPASYPHVITAGAIDSSLTSALFSNYNDYVDIAAPGVDIPVDTPLRFDVEDGLRDGQTLVSGTSFASPYVAGGLSWVLGARPDLDPSQAAAVLRSSATDLGTPGWDQHTGFGLIQVSQAMATPAPAADILEPNDDPAFTRASGKGTFGKRTVWSGSKRATKITAVGDSADDPVDAYRIKVPGKSRVKITVRASTGLTDLFAFDQSVSTFSGRPLDASLRSGTALDTITLKNGGRGSRVGFVVVNTVDTGVRSPSRYTLTIKRD